MGIRPSAAFVVLAAALAAPSPARAGDPDPLLEQLSTLEKTTEADIAAKAYDALVTDARNAAQLHKDAAGKDALRDRALAVVGSIVKVRNDDLQKAAIAILGDIGDEKGAKYVRGFLRPIDDLKVPAAVEATLAVIPKLPDDGLVEPLLQMVDASKNYGVAAKAITALGSFTASRRKREKILLELVKSVQKNQPGGKGKYGGGGGGGEGTSGGSAMDGSGSGGSGNGEGNSGEGGTAGGFTSQGQTDRWGPLSAALPEALTKLTGTAGSSAQEWFQLVKDNKGKLSALFVADAASGDKK